MNKKHDFILLTLAFFFFTLITTVRGQGWERTYADGLKASTAVRKVLPAADGGYLLLVGNNDLNSFGGMLILKVDAMGLKQSVWKYDFGFAALPKDMIATSDGGYAMLYQSQVGGFTFLTKLDAQLHVAATRQVTPDSSFVFETSGLQVFEHQQLLFVAGQVTRGEFGLAQHPFYAEFNLSAEQLGYTEWAMEPRTFVQAAQAPNGDFFVLTRGQNAVFDDVIHLERISLATKDVLWDKTSADAYGAVLALPTGGCIASMDSLIRLTDNGDVVWQKTPTYERLWAAGNNGFWGISTTVKQEIILSRLDANGDLTWKKILGAPYLNKVAMDLLHLPDGGCLMGGAQSLPGVPALPYAQRIRSNGEGFASAAKGDAVFDENGDCISESNTPLFGLKVIATRNDTLFNTTLVGATGKYFMPLAPGSYTLRLEKNSSPWEPCPDSLAVTVLPNDTLSGADFTSWYHPLPADSIFGSVFEDVDGDCIRDSFEIGYGGWNILAIVNEPNIGAHTYAVVTDSDGHFIIPNLSADGFTNAATGSFSIAQGNGTNCEVRCPQAFVIQFVNGTSCRVDLGVHCSPLPPCPVMAVDIATNSLRPCLASTYHVSYCNNGAAAAQNASIAISVDPSLEVTGSSIPWASVNGHTYTFELGEVATQHCGTFTLTVVPPCNAPLGTTYCTEAHAYPDTICAPAGANWDGSEILVSADCTGDSVVFTIQNVGTGAMQNWLEYVVIEDNVLSMHLPGQFKLNAGEEMKVGVESKGKFLRMEAQQGPGFPGKNKPVAWAEGCGGGGTVSLGFVNQYPLGDEEPWLAVFCQASTNSYDPNDKQGFPIGVREQHWIDQDIDLEYMIRFQNTGTAPAINVEVRDTIPLTYLDPATVQPGASSHPYEWDIQGNGVVVFRFPGIWLPDSSSNEAASHGFVRFRVAQRKAVPLGSKVENTAAIYFDHNPPVFTNQTLHTIGKDFLSKTTTSLLSDVRVNIQPNPASNWVRVSVEGLKQTSRSGSFVLLTALGQPVLNRQFTGASFDFSVENLPQGLYFYEVSDNGRLVATGKLVKCGER